MFIIDLYNLNMDICYIFIGFIFFVLLRLNVCFFLSKSYFFR